MRLGPFALWTMAVQAWVWRGEKGQQLIMADGVSPDPFYPPADASRLPNIYAVAIKELQDLESKPLCHRIAARLLVNDCRLLEGKDEATVLTDGGRKVRDFVDFYAASLAICDLERGGFAIPAGCAKFREDTLATIPVPKTPQLHVSSKQIDACLGAMAKSDSAWNTWVSYRHKALRFCEAARADNEKAQNIYLYQRITKVLAKLADDVDEEAERRMQKLDARIRQTGGGLEDLSTRIADLRGELVHLSELLSGDLRYLIETSAITMHDNLEDAISLQQILPALISLVSRNQDIMAATHDKVVGKMRAETENGVEFLISTLATAAASSLSLSRQMDQSNRAFQELRTHQGELEQGLIAIIDLAETLSVKYEAHHGRLEAAAQKADNLLDTLDEASRKTEKLQGSIAASRGILAWWPYAICPAFSLVLGSYGLPPSGFRNIILIAVGEALGFLVSTANRIAGVHYRGMVDGRTSHADIPKLNGTTPASRSP